LPGTGLAQHSRFREHITGPNHPERPQRLVRIEAVLADSGLAAACSPLDISPVEMSLVERIHTRQYLDRLQQACATGMPTIDCADSVICADSFEIAQLATGSVIHAVEAVMTGRLKNAFCAVRPPGHHAERDRSMGFCLINNIAVAAQYLIDRHGLSRVLILDWDVHHGNGTQHSFEADPRVLFISLHGHPMHVYPGTGYAEERGTGDGEGFTLNLPMMPGADDAAYGQAFDDVVLPRIDEFEPEFVLLSAGFDAHRRDPLAPLSLDTESFGWMTDEVLAMARKHCDDRLVSILEGGYDLDALGECVTLHLRRFLD